MVSNENIKNFTGLALGIGIVYLGYRVVFKKDSPVKAIENTIKAPIEVVKEVVEEVSDNVDKVIPKSIAGNKKSKSGEKGGEATARKGKHKGHKTKRGLSQDQKRRSSEEWERKYNIKEK